MLKSPHQSLPILVPPTDCAQESRHFIFRDKSYRVFQHIVLVGIMGAGKTSTGRLLAKQLEMPFVDSDRELESSSGFRIADLFDTYGAEEFREAESKIIQRLLKNPKPCVISSGGGSYLHAQTRKHLREHALSVWICAQLNTLVQRVSRCNNRPLLNKGNPREILAKMMQDRYAIYQEADFSVDSESASPKETANLVIEALCHFLDKKA